MASKTEEFINPKSMITPGFAAAIVATIAGALFSSFGVALPAALILLSFFVGGIVFHSKEFADPEMQKKWKAFFYVLNSLIIFAMATGTHSLLDKSKGGKIEASEMHFLSPVYAQGTPQLTPVLTQERPFFYDWTAVTDSASNASKVDKGIVTTKTARDFGPWMDILVNAKLATPTYKVSLAIDKAMLPGEVKSVTWHLPQHYFAKDKVTVSAVDKNFGLTINAWKPFGVEAEIELMSGEKVRVNKFLPLEPKKSEIPK